MRVPQANRRRILVTRPQPAAGATKARLEAMGHEVLLLPMMEAVHDQQAATEALASVHSAIAITSAEAIRALGKIDASRTPLPDTPVFCVGAATAQAARQSGFRTVIAGPGTGIGLAKLIAAKPIAGTRELSVSSHELLYLAGQPRAQGFENALAQAGISCRIVEVYRMSPIPYTRLDIEGLLAGFEPDTILFYSHETARHFFAVVQPQQIAGPPVLRLLCLSPHVAAAILSGISADMHADMSGIAIAAQPDEDSLLDLL